MPRPPSTWKAVELAIAKLIGGRRRGSDFRGEENAGKTDIVKPGWAIEVKHFKRVFWTHVVDAVRQAEINRTYPGDIPIAIVHQAGTPYKDSIVCMRLEEFIDYFVNDPGLDE